MKKILCFALLFTLLFTSCKLLMQEDYGTVIIDLEGKGERAVGANGLPELSSASMKIEIIDSRGGSLVKYLEENEAKVFHGNFIVGSELTVRVSLFTGSAVWVGNAGLTVAEGNNTVNLKLSKNAVFFKPFGFSVIKKGPSATYDITMPEGTIKITGASLGPTDNPEFCRDGKARLYIAYKTSPAANWKLERYNSDGSGKKEITLPPGLSNYTVKLAYDIKTGKTYLYCTYGSSNKFYPIGEDTVLSEINGGTLQGAYIAVYNGYLFTVKTNKLYMYKINGSSLSSVGSQKSLPGVKIAGSNKPVNCRDVFIKDNKIYILFTLSSITGSPYYSLGGIIEYAYTEEGIEDRPPNQYGFTDGLAPENNIIHTPENDFYGAVQVLGFEDDNIYIADEGFNNFNTSPPPITYSHVNRLAVFNTVTGNLSFKSTDYKWFLEAAAQAPVPGGKVLLLAKNTDTDKGFVYYQKNEGEYNVLSEQALIKYENVNGENRKPTDVFCYYQDEDYEHFYLLWEYKKNGNTKFAIKKYIRNTNGSYLENMSFVVTENLPDYNNYNLSVMPSAIAVCKDNSTTYLYYTYKQINTTYIKRINCYDSGASDPYTVTIADDGGSKYFCTALAANKDGVFAAIKSVDDEDTPTTYSADIRKYKHAGTSFYDGERSYISESIPSLSVDDFRLAEISDMQVKNDILYGVSVKKTGKLNNSGTTRVFTSGKLFKIENLSSAFNSSTEIKNLWSGDTETEGFAPYRIISGSENKLIIASDGYYGNKNLSPKVQNKNKVLNFSYPYNTLDVKDTEAKFSKELDFDGSQFEWK
ncbi:hypothetical protein [Treponema pedis]|uniref:hypothetical protein n=1 Tax=Treponema pedis TaxID=409322 RepID=UPI0004045C40|nr:hypothetical protein [Treponema pedis]